MMHKAWSSIDEVSYCFSRSSVKFEGHTALKIVEFDPNWVFPDCNSSLNSLMDMKWYTKLDVVWKTCLIIFRGHPSNFKVTRAKNWLFESNLSKITRPVAAIKSLRFAVLSVMSMEMDVNSTHVQYNLRACHVTATLQVWWFSMQTLLKWHVNKWIWNCILMTTKIKLN